MIPNEPVQAAGLISRAWSYFFTRVDETVESMRASGTTAQRPTKGLWEGRPYADTTLSIKVHYINGAWRNGAGVAV